MTCLTVFFVYLNYAMFCDTILRYHFFIEVVRDYPVDLRVFILSLLCAKVHLSRAIEVAFNERSALLFEAFSIPSILWPVLPVVEIV